MSCIALFDFIVLLGFTVNYACSVRLRKGSFAPAGATTGFALWIPTTFEKVDETLSVLALLLLLGGFCYAATAAETFLTAYSKT